jgi:subtilisin family serine protease
MRSTVRTGLVALALAATSIPSVAAAAPAGQAIRLGSVLPGASLLVTFADRPGAAEAAVRLRGLGALRPLLPDAGVWRVAAAPSAAVRGRALARLAVAAAEWSLVRRVDALGEPTPGDPAAAVRLLPTTPDAPPAAGIAAVPTPVPPPITPAAIAPIADPLFVSGRQWGLTRGRWTPAITGFATRPAIAILDAGVDLHHEEWAGTSSPLIFPRSTVRDDDNADDWGRTGHGTHVAGIAAAPANGLGIIGTAPGLATTAPVIPIQISDPDGQSTDETMIAGIRWAVVHGARVINISAGGPGFSQAFQNTVDWAFRRGALIVASVGNEGEGREDYVNYPAGYAHVLGVGAQCDEVVDPPDCTRPYGPASFTSHNRSLDVIAPGVDILSSVPLRVTDRQVAPGYALKDGTSMAAPYVAGAAALIFAANPSASPYQVLRQIQNTATDIGPRGRDDLSGYGILNTLAAVTLPLPSDDPGEVNDDVRFVADEASLKETGRPAVIRAAIDQHDDPDDLYPVLLRRGETVRATVTYDAGLLNLYLWRPRTRTVSTSGPKNYRDNVVKFVGEPGVRRQVLVAKAPTTGRYYLNVFARRGGGRYTLTIRRQGQ